MKKEKKQSLTKWASEDYIRLTDWETGKPIYLSRKKNIITEVTEFVATKNHTARTRVNTKDNLYLVTESAYQVICL